jgi:hypothetical protein
MGRIDPLKDLETLLRAAAIVHSDRQDVLFRLYGSAAPGSEGYYQRMLALCNTLGLDGVVGFEGYTSDPQSAYADSDVVVLSSISEAFPYSTLEAMLCGKPVVATSVGGVGEQLGDCGLLVEPRNDVELAEALISLLADPTRARRIGESARERAKDLFNLQVQNRLILDLYSTEGNSDLAETRAATPTNAPDDQPNDTTTAEREVAELVRRTADSVPHPVDALEIAAVIELNGINDAVARTRYGFENIFSLGEEVLGRIHANRPPTNLRPHDVTPPLLELRRIPEIGLGLLLVLPAAVVLLIGHFLIAVPGWTSGTGRALMLGVTSSMVITNAVLFGIVRRSSLLIGCARWRGARRFLWRMSWVTALTLLTGEAIGLFIAGQVGTVQGSELTTFALSFSGLAAFWILSGGFVVLGRSHEPGMAVLVGVSIGILVDRLLEAGSPRHLDIAILVAYLSVLCLIGARVVYLLTSDRGGSDSYQRPRSSYVFDEALPYFA